MKTLRIYGDSFASADQGSFSVPAGWGNMLGDLMKLPVKNNAISGSSTEYAIQTFVKDFTSSIINDDDIIIFVTSSPGRLYFSHQLHQSPRTASMYLHGPVNFGTGSHDWYYKNKDHIEWWMANNDRTLQSINFESYIQLLKNFAVSRPSCTVIVLPAYNTGYNKDIFNTSPPANFLRAGIFLKDVSEAEVIGLNNEFDFNWWIEFAKIDPRANHLTKANLSILANLLFDSIQVLSIDNITYDKFQSKNINKITSKEQYLTYISDGLLTPSNYILANLK